MPNVDPTQLERARNLLAQIRAALDPEQLRASRVAGTRARVLELIGELEDWTHDADAGALEAPPAICAWCGDEEYLDPDRGYGAVAFGPDGRDHEECAEVRHGSRLGV